MNHCKDKKKHKFENKYNILKECTLCGKIKMLLKYLQRGRKGRKKTLGAFGDSDRFLGEYATLKILPRSKRTAENCNANGVALVNEYKVEEANA